VSSRGVTGDEGPDGSTKDVRFNAGVSPLEAFAVCALVSGNGSENRTRFFDFVGVLGGLGVVEPAGGELDCSCWLLGPVGSDSPLLTRLLRRTAIGLSSRTSSSACCTSCFPIVGLVYCYVGGKRLGMEGVVEVEELPFNTRKAYHHKSSDENYIVGV